MECLFQFGQIAAPSSGKTSIHPVKLHVCRNKEEHLALKLLWAYTIPKTTTVEDLQLLAIPISFIFTSE